METNKKNGNSRKIDLSIEKTFESVGPKIVLVSSMKVAAWKSYLVITFVAGFFAALIWGAYISWFPIGKAADTSPTLHTYSTAGFHKTNDTFATDVILNTNSKGVVAVQAILSYDPNTIEVLGVDTASTLFNLEVLKTTDNTTGKVFLAVAKPTPGVNSANEKIATISARAKKDFLEPGYNLAFSSSAKIADNSAAILNDGLGTNGLGRVYADFPAVSTPTVSITAPVAGAVLSGSVQISANVQSSLGIASVEFFADGNSIATDAISPYNTNWDATKTPNGNHTLAAKACDAATNCATSAAVTVNVNNALNDKTPPVISKVNISNISSSGATVTWTTDEKSTSQVSYGADTNYGNSTSLNTTRVTRHKAYIKRLKTNTNYHLVVSSADSAGNKSQSSDYSFRTR